MTHAKQYLLPMPSCQVMQWCATGVLLRIER